MRDELISDMGGADNSVCAKLALIEMIARHLLPDECERRIFRVIHKVSVQERALESLTSPSHPKLIATLYGYRRSVANIESQRRGEGWSWKP